MFTNNKAKYYGDNKVLIEAACLRTDTKPTTGIANGSKCIEMDTGKTFMFNEEDSEWEELPSSGGGGGGSSDFSTAQVTITNSTSSNITQSCINVLELMGEQTMSSELPPLGANGSVTCDMVLFKGTQLIYAPDDVNIAVNGDITEEEGVIVINGDGTITYTSK